MTSEETNFEQISKTNAKFKQKILSMKNYVEKFLDQKPTHDTHKIKSSQAVYSQRKQQPTPNSPQFSNFNSTLFKNESIFSNHSANSQSQYPDISYVPHQSAIPQQSTVYKQKSLQRDKDIINRIDSFMNNLNISSKNKTKHATMQNFSNKISNYENSNSQFSSSSRNFDTLDYSSQVNITPRTNRNQEKQSAQLNKKNKNSNQLPPRKISGHDFNKNKLQTIEEELKNTLTIEYENQNKKKQKIATPIKQQSQVKNTIQIQKAKIKQAMSAKKKINQQFINPQKTIRGQSDAIIGKQTQKKEKIGRNQINQMNISVDFQLSDQDQQCQAPIKNITHQKIEKLVKKHSRETLLKQKAQLQKQLQQIENQIQILQQQTIS